MRLGLDPDGLDAVAATMDRGEATLEALARVLDAAAREVAWHGADADRFHQQWHSQLRPAVLAAATTVRSAATDARRQAADQRRASDGITLTTAVAAVAALDIGASTGRSRDVVPAAPERVRLMTAELSVSNRVTAGATLRVRVEDLGDGRSRISELDQLEGGVEVDADRRGSVSYGAAEAGAGAGVAASLSASAGLTRSWIVPTGDVDDFLVSRLVDPNGTTGRSTVGSIVAAVPSGGLAAALFGVDEGYRAVTYERPAPERVGIVAGASGSLDGGAGSGESLDLAGAADHGVVLGATRSSVDGSMTVELAVGLVAAASIGTAGGGIDWSGTTTLTIDRSGTPTSLATVVASVDDGRVEQRHGVIDLTAPDVRREAGDLLDAIGSATSEPAGADERIAAAVRELIVAGTDGAATRTDVYAVTDARSYGIELPMGSAVISTEELRLER